MLRPEPATIRSRGYEWDDPRDIVDLFEKKLAGLFRSKACSPYRLMQQRTVLVDAEFVKVFETIGS
jgi:hypothetical protein